jgi:lipoprotein-anchoring transpeptidase ErfK/SrfK
MAISFGVSSANAQFFNRYDDRGGWRTGPPRNAFISGDGRVYFMPEGRRNFGPSDPAKHKANEAFRKAPRPPAVKGPLLIAISIAKQKLTLYDGGVPIATSPVSTGTASHPTPMGVFSIIGKERFHRSNLYSAAPMPFMQRITWSGVALHAGVLPGHPASHGCIRLPQDFAVRLYHTTKMGARVIISQNELTPNEIAHARLFAPKVKPSPEPPANAAPPEAQPPAAVPPVQEERPLEDRPLMVNAEPSAKQDAAGPAGAKAASVKASTSTDGTAASQSAEHAVANVAGDEAAMKAVEPAAAPVTPAVTVVTSAEPVAPVVKAPEPAPKAPQAIVTAGDKPAPSLVIMAGLRPSVTHSVPRIIPERLRSGPVSVFVSRKEKRLYVRKGFEPVFDVPIEIANPDRPIGTHVFTAMDVTEKSARWSVVSMPAERLRAKRIDEPQSRRGKYTQRAKTVELAIADIRPAAAPAEALDRLVLPQDAVDRISELLTAGASLIISDQGLGPETGLETDFIVVTR